MAGSTTRTDVMLIPYMRYDDAPAMIDWLERAFGFERGDVFTAPDGRVEHAELALGGGVIMVGSAKEDALALRSPRALGGATQGVYVALDDVDAHHARAVAAGAEIVVPLADTSYGSREYTARDPEGHLWSFGTYRPTPGGRA